MRQIQSSANASNPISTYTFDNGLVLLTEEMDWCESVSYAMYLPCGAIHDPVGRYGLANLTCEMVLRGAGNYGNREFTEAFENLGTERSESVSQSYAVFAAQSLSTNLFPTLDLLADSILRPQLKAEQLPSARQVVIQEILAVEDEPSQQLMIELGKQFFPDPWGRPSFGNVKSVERISLDDIRGFHDKHYRPNGAIFSVAGKFQTETLREKIGELFRDWKAKPQPQIIETVSRNDYVHIPFDSAQTHIGIAYPSVPFGKPDYYSAWSGVSVLNGGLSGRLFTELREKRGLCYVVSASYLTLGGRGCAFCYCGTTAVRASESLNVLCGELTKLQDGITEEELKLLKIRAKSALVVQQESTASRSSSMSRDWHYLERIRTKEEIEKTISGLTTKSINDYLEANPPGPFCIVTLGPQRPVA